jgi:endonuclease YncB( thermonuclease family)
MPRPRFAHPLALALFVVLAGAAAGAENGPYKVIFIPDALTLMAQSPDEDEPERIALRWLAAPPDGDPAAAEAVKALRALLPAGTMIKLVAPEAEPPRDRKGRLQAVVVIAADGTSVQESQLKAGWAGFAPDPSLMAEWKERLARAVETAKQARVGGWASDAAWLRAPAPAPAPTK